MQITNEILLSFLHCPYKAYRKRSSENGKLSDFEQLSKEFTISQKVLFAEKLSTEKRLIGSLLTETDFTFTNGVIINQRFSNTNVELFLDGIEFIGKNRIIPILITPFEKITQTDKLFIALQSSYIQSEFNLNIESCKIIYGKNFNETNLKFASFAKNIKKIIAELNKMLSDSGEPSLILNKHCSVCEYNTFCKEKAKADDNLSLLDRATSKTIEKYKKKGIFTIQQLSYIYKPRRRKKHTKELFAHNLELQALALRTDKIYVQQLPELPSQSIRLFLDIEGIPDQESYYLIGVLVCKDETTICKRFWADKMFDEAQIWQKFLSLLNDYPDDAPLYHYGNYESKAIDILGKRYNTDVVHLQNRLINIVNSIYGKIYFPVYSNRLKELGNYLGVTWSSANASGIQSLVWRYLWEGYQNEKYKQLLITYNLEDCKALKLLTDKLMQIQESSSILPDIDFAINPKKISSHLGSQIHQELDIILKFAHENYDSNKINFSNIRPNEVLKIDNNKIGGKIGHKGVSRKIPKAKKKIITPIKRVCTICKSKLTKTSRKAERTITDLVFTKFAIRKTVIKYVGYKSYCTLCKKYFPPPQVEKIGLNHFGHNLKAWVVYQRLFLRLPFKIIKLNLMEMFNENISEGSISNILNFFSLYYKYTENQNLKQILNSPFIHVDETQINVKGVNHYVWILTNGKQVFFRETETREIYMMVELLKEYNGILISDFYPGYDSLKCKHQKCWVHLIRDLNDDLYKNPYNIEYETFIYKLKNLIIPIFSTIEKYGSKRRHFNKFKKDIDLFYNQIILNENYNSELTQKYQTRLKKQWINLFTFLDFDNIPWNNNMAERGIRHLAVQRKISTYFDNGISDYLLLLGIMQTCKFQNKSFLKFLLSEKKSID